MKPSHLFTAFFKSEKAGGFLLICCTMLSLGLANTAGGVNYLQAWHLKFGGESIEYWINDGLMTLFFLLVGLELKRELFVGELSNLKNALLPIFAALGGMLVPAGLYLAFNFGTPYQSGAGIPMATDIAFALAVLSMLGKRVPAALKVFLAALAIIDDLGAILVIAFFYTSTLSGLNLGIAVGILGFLYVLNRLKVCHLFPYLLGGAIMWWFMLHSGIHATITGVLLAFVIPSGKGAKSASAILESSLHKPVAFFILPLFALANTAIAIHGSLVDTFSLPHSIGIAVGLIVGKPLGIFLLSFLACASGICKLPPGINWKLIIGVGFLGGIGFTMSVFITLLAFKDEATISQAKWVILLSSLIAGIVGFLMLRLFIKKRVPALLRK